MDEWKELLQDFLSEAYSLLDSLEDSLLNLEKQLDDPSQIATVFRVAHTIKGGAGAMGFQDITGLTHIMEDVLDLVRNNKYHLTQNDITLLLDVRDELYHLLQSKENNTERDLTQTNFLIESLNKMKEASINGTARPSAVVAPEVQETDSTPTHDLHDLPLAARFCIQNNDIDAFEVALNTNEPLMFVEIDLNPEYELKEVSAFELIAIINKFSEPIVMNPSYELLDDDFFPYLNVVFATEESEEFVKTKLSLSDVVLDVRAKKLDQMLMDQLKNPTFGIPQTPTEQVTPPITTPQASVEQVTPPITTPQASVEQVTPPITTPQAEAAVPVANQEGDSSKTKEEKKNPTLKIESFRIDELLNLLGELVIIRSGLGQFENTFDKSLQELRSGLRGFLSSSYDLHLNDDPDQNSIQNGLVRSAYTELTNSLDQYIEYIQQFSRISGLLQTQMMNLRMIPVQSVFSRFTRLVRDIGKQLNKKIELIFEGGETEIDKGIIDDLYDPLMHMIRNSLDHGIELPEDRVKAGKSEVGRLTLRAYQEGDLIFIEVADDGKGIDAEYIKTKAINKGFITQETANSLSDQEALQLIFMPGFSTAEQVSNLSGRGVGMDVVIRTFEELGGSVSIFSQKGEGSIITIKLPLTLAIIQGLVLLISDIHYVIPIVNIEETVIIMKDNLYPLNNYYALKFRNQLIPLIDLPHILYQEEPFHTKDFDNSYYCVIIKFGNRQVGIIVPDILGEQDIVVKPMNTELIYSPGISAATIIGNGEIGYILDIGSLVQYCMNTNHKEGR